MRMSLTINDLNDQQLAAVHAALQTVKFETTSQELGNLLSNKPSAGIPQPSSPIISALPADDEIDIPAGDVALIDENGVPWHPDFHSSAKSQTAEGAWKRRKGADKVAAAEYEKSFHSLVTNTKPSNIVPLAPARMVEQAAPFAPPLPFGMPVEPERVISYDELRSFYGTLSAAGKIDLNALTAIIKDLGLVDSSAFANNPAACTRAYKIMQERYAA